MARKSELPVENISQKMLNNTDLNVKKIQPNKNENKIPKLENFKNQNMRKEGNFISIDANRAPNSRQINRHPILDETYFNFNDNSEITNGNFNFKNANYTSNQDNFAGAINREFKFFHKFSLKDFQHELCVGNIEK